MQNCCFHEIFVKNLWERISVCTVWKNVKFTATQFFFFFCQINLDKSSSVKKLISRNFWDNMVGVKFRNFHTVLWRRWKWRLKHDHDYFTEESTFSRQINVARELITRKKSVIIFMFTVWKKENSLPPCKFFFVKSIERKVNLTDFLH